MQREAIELVVVESRKFVDVAVEAESWFI